MTAKTVTILTEVEATLQSIAEFKNKVISSDDQEDLLNRIAGTPLPCIGVIYSGARAAPETQPSSRTGHSSEVMFHLVIAVEKNKITKDNLRNKSLELLDKVRVAFIGTKSATGHKFRFLNETYAADTPKAVLWVQGWAVPVQFT